jgi:hypothetical protein
VHYKNLIVSLALVMTSAGGAVAASGTTADEVPSNAQVRVIPGAPECGGPNFSKIVIPLSATGYSCVHNAVDAPNPYAAEFARKMGIKPATAKVPCYGDGTTGPRIQFIYGYGDGMPNRSKTVISQVRTQMAPRMQAVINGQSHGRDLGLRFAMTKGCGAVDVKVIKFPESVLEGYRAPEKAGDGGGQLGRAANVLTKLGYDRTDRKYLILWDGWTRNGVCGIAETAILPPASSLPVAPLSEGYPTLGARTDVSTVTNLPATKYAMVFNHVGGRKGPSCFAQGMSGVTVQIHELFHTLGAVQLDSPNSNGEGHCDDAPSIMCSGNAVGYGAGVFNPSCAKVLVETLDCGEDDYWNPQPPVGSYLQTHLNIAKSRFFGAQPQDNLTASPL